MFNELVMLFIRWYLKRKIIWCQNLATANVVDRSDIRYMNKSADYWIGCGEGIDDALQILGLKE